MHTVYVLVSVRDKKRYIGITQNLNRRLAEHNRGAVRSTARRCPLRVVYTEEYDNKREALRRETFLKSGKGRAFLDEQLHKPA